MYLIPLRQNSQMRSTQPTRNPKLTALDSLCSTQPTGLNYKKHNEKETDVGKDS